GRQEARHRGPHAQLHVQRGHRRVGHQDDRSTHNRPHEQYEGHVMATDYGSGLLMLDDMPDPEVMGSGELLVAYDIARRWLEPAGTHALIGNNAPYDSFDIREYLGARFGLNDRSVLDEIQQNCIATASQDPRVESLTV